jgi:hypothetical protein
MRNVVECDVHSQDEVQACPAEFNPNMIEGRIAMEIRFGRRHGENCTERQSRIFCFFDQYESVQECCCC